MIRMNRSEFQNKGNQHFSLAHWNSYYSELYLPNTILIALGLFIGIGGNVLVIFVYQRGLKDKGHGRYFIPMLAKSDLACITVSSLYNIVQITRHVTFPDSWICKSFLYILRVVLANSTFIMTVIAVNRYQHICKRFKWDFTSRNLKIFIILAELFILTSNLSPLFTYGTVTVNRDNVTGYMCKEVDDEALQVERKMIIFTGIYHSVEICLICVSYGLIAINVHKTVRKMASSRQSTVKEGIREKKKWINNLRRLNSTSSNRKTPWLTYRITLMFFISFLFMLIAFIPPYILMDLETKDPQYWDRKNDNISKNALLVLRMLYSTNTIVNPFIYGFFDNAFRRKLVAVIFKRN